MSFSKNQSYVMHISFTLQQAEIVGNYRQCSSVVNSLGSFFMVPYKSSCLWLFPFPPYDKFKKPLATSLFPHVPQFMTSQNTQFPLTFVYSLAQGHWVSMKSLPTEKYWFKNGVFQIHPRVSDFNFPNNISVPQV